MIDAKDLFPTVFSLGTNFSKIILPLLPLINVRVTTFKVFLGLHEWEPSLILCWAIWTLHANLQFGLICLFLHYFKNHAACFRGPVWGGMDGDGFLCGPRIFLSMDVYPVGKESGAIAQCRLAQDPNPSQESVAPAHVQQGHRQGSGTSTSATSAILQEGGKQYRGCLMPNLNALQLHLEGNLSYRHAVGQKAPSQLGHEARLVNEVFCHPLNDHRSEE